MRKQLRVKLRNRLVVVQRKFRMSRRKRRWSCRCRWCVMSVVRFARVIVVAITIGIPLLSLAMLCLIRCGLRVRFLRSLLLSGTVVGRVVRRRFLLRRIRWVLLRVARRILLRRRGVVRLCSLLLVNRIRKFMLILRTGVIVCRRVDGTYMLTRMVPIRVVIGVESTKTPSPRR